MHRRLAAAALLGALVRAVPHLPETRRRTDFELQALAGADLEPELLLADHGERGGLDVNEDQEDYQEPTMADLVGGKVHLVRAKWKSRWNATGGLAGQGNGFWTHLRGRQAWPEAARAYEVPAYETEAWATVMYARKLGPHRHMPSSEHLSANVHALLHSASAVDWYFLTLVLVVIIAMDVAIFQHLPETARTHVVLLFFWLLVAVVFCVEVWLRLGPEAGVIWTTGYVLELIFSVDNILVVHLIFCTFETPRRLMSKALFLGLLSSITFRIAFVVGLATTLDKLKVVPYCLGLWLIYCGTRQVSLQEEETADVTQTAIVRGFRSLLGERLCEFYDEEGEALIAVNKGKHGMTLLGVVVLCLLVANFFLGFDIVLTKAEELPNAYLSFSSSALATFATRAMFFAMRDVFSRFCYARYGIGLALLFMGAETLLSHAVYVNALMSFAVIAVIVALSVVISWVRGPCPKMLAQ
mmetsp:Transcript_86022/g.200009  ORF Transcript_86022/g.200009 Transcript_86022/m.200009 type:complete len:470 (+) Transcript_86022:135-1544(+)